jgi:hypothetical protein
MANDQSGFELPTAVKMQRFAPALVVAWVVVAVAAILLGIRYADMPGLIPVYRDASGYAAVFAPKSAAIVFRIAAMGAAQLGATTAMWLHARAVRNTGWAKFWVYAGLAAAAKTLVECVQYAALGTPLARQPAALWFYAALLPVLVFLGLAVNLWRTGQVASRAAGGIRPRTIVALCVWLGLWFACATLPKWLD